MTISTERLRKIASGSDFVADVGGKQSETVTEIARELLAVREAQNVPAPYNQVQRDMMKDIVVQKLDGNLLGETLDMDDIHAVTMELMSAGFRLHAAPPAPAVPTEKQLMAFAERHRLKLDNAWLLQIWEDAISLAAAPTPTK